MDDYLPSISSIIDATKKAKEVQRQAQFSYFFKVVSDNIHDAAAKGKGECRIQAEVKSFDLIFSEKELPKVIEEFICNGYEVTVTNHESLYSIGKGGGEPFIVFVIKWV